MRSVSHPQSPNLHYFLCMAHVLAWTSAPYLATSDLVLVCILKASLDRFSLHPIFFPPLLLGSCP